MKKKNNLFKIISSIIGITLMISIMAIIIIPKINNNNSRRNLQIIGDIDIDIDPGTLYIEGEVTCYTNETKISWATDYSGKYVTCTKPDYLVTHCSSYQVSNGRDGIYYGVKNSNGNSCYSKFAASKDASSSSIEPKGSVTLQARCCKSKYSNNKLQVDYRSRYIEQSAHGICSSLSCPVLNNNFTSIGSAIKLGNPGSHDPQYQGVSYRQDGIRSNFGNNTNVYMDVFCGKIDNSNTNNNYVLNCITFKGNIGTGYLDRSTINCPNFYSMLSCDSENYKLGDWACRNNATEYISGSYIQDSTCNSIGNGNRAVARCCKIQ